MSTTTLTGVKIWDDTGYYYTEIDLSQSFTYKTKTQVQESRNSQYPYVIHIGKTKYWEGSVSGNFSNNKDGECENDYNFYDLKYKLGFVEFLKNGLTKTIQFNWDEEDPTQNFIMPIAIVDDIGVETEYTINEGHAVKVSFKWVQVGSKITV